VTRSGLTFSTTKTRAELNQIKAEETNWLNHLNRQQMRKRILNEAEQDLVTKKAYLQEVLRVK
jgi:hypothetical protein